MIDFLISVTLLQLLIAPTSLVNKSFLYFTLNFWIIPWSIGCKLLVVFGGKKTKIRTIVKMFLKSSIKWYFANETHLSASHWKTIQTMSEQRNDCWSLKRATNFYKSTRNVYLNYAHYIYYDVLNKTCFPLFYLCSLQRYMYLRVKSLPISRFSNSEYFYNMSLDFNKIFNKYHIWNPDVVSVKIFWLQKMFFVTLV